MNLSNADIRRGLRSAVQAIVVLALIALVYWITGKIKSDHGLIEIARWSLIIIALGTCGYIIENGVRSLSWKGPGGIGGSMSTDAAEAGQEVADQAQNAADKIKEQTP